MVKFGLSLGALAIAALAYLDGHVSGFAFFGGVPLSVLYDNTAKPN